MGQSGYAENFTTLMLGWMRNLASSLASMFQSGGGADGSSFLTWFSQNWLGLLIFLIVLGVLIDWLVWLFRWRPYWLWFRKRRIVLDNDIDDVLSDRDVERRYGTDRSDGAPRFQWDINKSFAVAFHIVKFFLFFCRER